MKKAVWRAIVWLVFSFLFTMTGKERFSWMTRYAARSGGEVQCAKHLLKALDAKVFARLTKGWDEDLNAMVQDDHGIKRPGAIWD